MLASGIVWLVAGLLAYWTIPTTSLLAFFFGGMLIHPAGVALCRLGGRSGKADAENPLTGLAIESTVLLFVGLFLAWLVFQLREPWFYPTMLLVIGTRYLLFRSMYGNRTYWALGGVLIALGVVCLVTGVPLYVSALLGGGTEVLFAGYLYRRQSSR